MLAAAGFAGALLLTPNVELAMPSIAGGISAHPLMLRRGAGAATRVPVDSITWEREVVARYDHLPLAQILSNSADPAMAIRVARAIVKEARELQLSPLTLSWLSCQLLCFPAMLPDSPFEDGDLCFCRFLVQPCSALLTMNVRPWWLSWRVISEWEGVCSIHLSYCSR